MRRAGIARLIGTDGSHEVAVMLTFADKVPWVMALFAPDEDASGVHIGRHWRTEDRQEALVFMDDEADRLREAGCTTTLT